MKIKVNSDIIKSLGPCKDRLVNYLNHYNELNFDILEFLHLDKISAEDKVWVSVRLMPINLVQKFALECSSRASTYAAKSVAYAQASDTSYVALNASRAALNASRAAAYDAASYTALTAASAAHTAYKVSNYYTASHASYAVYDAASDEERELQLKSIAQLIEGNK